MILETPFHEGCSSICLVVGLPRQTAVIRDVFRRSVVDFMNILVLSTLLFIEAGVPRFLAVTTAFLPLKTQGGICFISFYNASHDRVFVPYDGSQSYKNLMPPKKSGGDS